MRGSRGYRAAAEHIAGQLRAHRLNDVRILEFPANGQRFYGTQRSRPAWNADFAELWDLRPADGGVDTRDTGRELGGHATVRRRWRSSPST